MYWEIFAMTESAVCGPVGAPLPSAFESATTRRRREREQEQEREREQEQGLPEPACQRAWEQVRRPQGLPFRALIGQP